MALTSQPTLSSMWCPALPNVRKCFPSHPQKSTNDLGRCESLMQSWCAYIHSDKEGYLYCHTHKKAKKKGEINGLFFIVRIVTDQKAELNNAKCNSLLLFVAWLTWHALLDLLLYLCYWHEAEYIWGTNEWMYMIMNWAADQSIRKTRMTR